MNGVKYYRIKNGMTQNELIRRSGISQWALWRMEHTGRESGLHGLMPEYYLRLREVLGVTVDELLREDLPEVEDNVRVRNMRSSSSDCNENCLAIYRQRHRLTLRELADILHVSHESVRLASQTTGVPQKYISRLAEYEGLSENEFQNKYTFRKEGYHGRYSS